MSEQLRSLEDLAKLKAKEEEERNKLPYASYLKNLVELVGLHDQRATESVRTPEPDSNGEYICIREPLEFLNLFQSCNGQDECVALFRKLLDDRDGRVIAQIIKQKPHKNGLWFNTTHEGVNLRPGLRDGAWANPGTVTLGDDAVHGILAGRTGSGKSVFLNSIIFSLMAEYSPWELDLFLADFKKVEFSRYLSKYEVPHIKAVAATSEIRYVVSLLSYLAECMKARQDFFAYLGLQKISEVREHYNIVLPRVLLIVDEFQQLFLESTTREQNVIIDMLTSITKLGRATGYHLLFASQEMSGTLGGNVLSNFKAKFALSCTPEVSNAILGNSEASKIDKKGIVISNLGGGKEGNVTYKVPFIADDYFYDYLAEITVDAQEYGFSTVHKFYQEDSIRDYSVLEKLLDAIKPVRAGLLNRSSGTFDIVTLGESVVFNYKKYDFETVFLERGVRKNIGVFSPSVEDTAYVCKLLATNFRKSPLADKFKHYVLARNDLFIKQYDITSDVQPQNEVITSMDLLDDALAAFQKRKREASLLNNYRRYSSLEDFAHAAFMLRTEYIADYHEERRDSYSAIWREVSAYFRDHDIADIPEVKECILGDMEMDKSYFHIIDMLYKMHTEHKSSTEVFEPNIIWLIGCEMMDRLPRGAEEMLADSAYYNMLFVLVASNIDFQDFYTLHKTCDYLFVTGNNESYYNKLKMPFTRKSEGSVAVDFAITSTQTQRSFKKFKYDLSEVIVPEIDFDSILSR